MNKIIKKILIFNNNKKLIKRIKSLKVNLLHQTKDSRTLQNKKIIVELNKIIQTM